MAASRTREIIRRLRDLYPEAKVSLDYENPFQLLIATILSAQSTDARVNIVTKDLFRKYPGPHELAAANLTELETDIKPTGFFRSKAKSIMGAASAIVERHRGVVPNSMEDLVALPGVGRKTANVVLGNAFGRAEGVVVDTHVTRVSGRLALTEHADAGKIEQDLMEAIPRAEWTSIAHRLILHGRNVCVARKPRCGKCLLSDLCPSAELPVDQVRRKLSRKAVRSQP